MAGFLPCQMFAERAFQHPGQRDDAVFLSLAIVYGDGALAEIDVLDAQPQRLHEPQARAVHQLGRQPPRVLQMAEHGTDLLARQDHGRTTAVTCGRSHVEREIA